MKAERIKEWSLGNRQGPVRVELHPTDRCNLKCKFCWQSAVEKVDGSNELSDEKLHEIVREAAEIGVKEWIISGGGEPLMRKQATLNALTLIKKNGMRGQLTTNGVLFSNEDIRRIIDIGWDQIQFSIDGPDAKTHDYLRNVSGTFKKAIGNAKLLSRNKKATPYLGFNTVLNRLNYKKLPEMIKLCHSVGFSLVYFEPIYAGYTSTIRLNLSEDEEQEMTKYIEEAVSVAHKLRISTNIEQFKRKELLNKSHFTDTIRKETANHKNPFLAALCYQPWYLIGIKGSGLSGCCSTFETGEMLHDKTLKEVWFGSTFNKTRKEMLLRRLPSYCSKCSVVVVMENKEIRKQLKERLRQTWITRLFR
jgi:MoaA/NifB/PqqE/SkfB family radical SAM enzyme